MSPIIINNYNMTTINKPTFIDNQVRIDNPEIKDKGDKYIQYQSIKKKERTERTKNNTDSKELTPKQIFTRKRNQYISCLNLGRIKKINTDRLYEYGIVFNKATGKYEGVNAKYYFNLPKIISDNSNLWNDTFNPEIIINQAISISTQS